MRYFKCNSAKHFACDCKGLRNNINIVMDLDQELVWGKGKIIKNHVCKFQLCNNEKDIKNTGKFPKMKLLFKANKALQNWNQGQVP